MKNEIWKDIEGYEGIYQVSNLGRVRSLDRIAHRERDGYSYDIPVKGRVLRPRKTKKGYIRVLLLLNDNFGHLLVAQAECLHA